MTVNVNAESLRLAPGPGGSFLSVAADSERIAAVFADPSTATLDFAAVPSGPHLPAVAPAAEVIDKVDVAPPLAPFFGENILRVDHGTVGVLYLDRETDTRNVLKLAWKGPSDAQWNLDAMDPAGDPLYLQPDGKSGFSAAWSSGTISYRSPAGQVTVPVPPISLRLVGRSSQTLGGGFSAYDSIASVLLAFQWTGTGFSAQAIPDGTPIQASLRSADGRLAVLSWDPSDRRLLLRRERSPGAFSTQTVTVCEGTTGVALLPGSDESQFLFVFNETRSLGAGRVESLVSVVGPGGLLGARGSRYRKAVLSRGETFVDGFAATRTQDSLYVLVSQGDVRLLRVPLHR
ncbi:MAG TPA: hypothetical protein VFI08_10265 [Spirochaetia bacterium]|nr:hypothetical protein [Spirochaetia bacterium]